MVEKLYSALSASRQNILMLLDLIAVLIAGYLGAYLYVPEVFSIGLTVSSLCSAGVALYIYKRIGLYQSVVRFMADEVFRGIMTGTLFAASTFTITSIIMGIQLPAHAIIVFGSALFLMSSAMRFLIKDIFTTRRNRRKTPVLIYGAGSAGRQLMLSLHVGEEYSPIAYVDDDRSLHGRVIHGGKVYSPSAIGDLIVHFGITKILLAIPSATQSQRRRVLEQVEKYQVEVKTIAGVAEIISGKVQITQLKDIDIEDLLGREPVQPDINLMGKCITDKVVLVTGAGGSIGSELCRQIIEQNPKKVILLEQSEYGLYSIDKELRALRASSAIEIAPVLGSACNYKFVLRLIEHSGVQTIYHAAAYKHVPLVEFNVAEGVRNNIVGTYNCAAAALEHKVEHFVLISTDKAVRPTNFMGASKRCAELVVQAHAKLDSNTKFSMVRFGNVLGSSGSVVPLFKQQITNGGPVTVTHKDITRYFMTIPEAAQLVIQAGAMAKGGDVFVLDMGEPVKISDLAKKMIHLMGFEVKGQSKSAGDTIEIVYSGLRPGEKLYEELLIGDDVEGTNHPRIMTANEVSVQFEEMNVVLTEFHSAFEQNDCARIKELLMGLPIQLKHDAISDLFWEDSGLKNEMGESNVVKLAP